MVRIWYSVCGEGYGHATRSDAILSQLVKRHEVIITAWGKAYPYLRERYGGRVHRIAGHEFVYKDNRLLIASTFLKFLAELPYFLVANTGKVVRLMERFRPEVIITDAESAAAYYGRIRRTPVICIDNNQCLLYLTKQVPWHVRTGLRFVWPQANWTLIPSFFTTKTPDRVLLIKPPLRRAVLHARTSDAGFGLVYQTSATNERMLSPLRKTGRPFRIYGMGPRPQEGNLSFFAFNEERFLADLASSSYVIQNGGFSLMAEALFLKKPVLSVPVRNHEEQEYNALHLARLGYGMRSGEVTARVLRAFEASLPRYRRNLQRLKPWDNVKTIRIIEGLVGQHTSRPPAAPRSLLSSSTRSSSRRKNSNVPSRLNA